MKKNISNKLVKTAVVAALYTVLTVMLAPISYGIIQFRVSEVMVLLAFFNPLYIGGLTLGCLISNIFGGNGPLDIILGTFATFISVVSISLTSKILKTNKFSLAIASIWPVVFNGVIIGWMLNIVSGAPLLLTMVEVGLSEFIIISIIGVPLALLLKNKYGTKLNLAKS
ncbi:QueT transporter family protein [Clostridium gasigenes]|uniref:QueT transporter family protein n=1 Tax=Clostridium gasigenes TaxID=94869 RepID=UPI0014385CEB|nr:QueT transporter family protein [Clostridium gasigenes]NKF05443.1 QueT transporter family protein [Clostridium gasigenes]QSW18889.1 QueT transporter family protein [Clostridium gasigenes]